MSAVPHASQVGRVPADDLAVHRWFKTHDRGGEFCRDELEAMVADLAGRPDLWSHLIRRSRDGRCYSQLLLTEHVEISLISWSAGSETLIAVGRPRGPIVRVEAAA
jgi:hypothetical protein